MKVEKTFFVDAPIEKVLETIRDPGLIEESEKSRDALSAEVKEVKKDASEHIYEIHTESYARGLTGLDKSKTERNVVTSRWDLKSRTENWQWKGSGQHADKASISGTTQLMEKGNGTNVCLSTDIEISVPLLGKKISKMVAQGFQDEWPKYIQMLTGRVKA